MSLYAYRDPGKSDRIDARDFYREPPGRTYYCPGHDCPARLTAVLRRGVKEPYFRALPAFPHRDGCPFANSAGSPEERYDESQFDFSHTITDIMSADGRGRSHRAGASSGSPAKPDPGSGSPKTPQTICQLYELFKQLPPLRRYGGTRVADMLFDSRSSYLHAHYVSGDKLIECHPRRRFYDEQKGEFYLESLPENNRYRLILTCQKLDLFKKIRSLLFNHRNSSFVVAGNWSAAS